MKTSFFERIANWINGYSESNAKKSKKRKGSSPSNTSQKNVSTSGNRKATNRKKDDAPSNRTKQKKNVVATTTVTKSNVPGQNSIEKKNNLVRFIILLLQSNYRGEQHSMKDKMLSISILDSMFYDSVNSSDFKKLLETSISDELGMVFNRIEIKDELFVDINMSELFSNVYIGIKPTQDHNTIRKAIILPVENNGSTISTEYFLDSEEIVKLPNCRYNIGAGKHPVLADNSYRENHIAIDDDPNSCEYAKNKYVSRSHANISYSEELGFLLNVEYGGSRAAQKRTYIHRGNEKIELNNTLVPVPLRNGDYIVLSKYVYLLFKEA